MRAHDIHDFTLKGIIWQCHVIDGGCYEWRSTCGRYAVFREGRNWRARRGDRVGKIDYPSIKAAMLGASNEARRTA